MPPQCFSILNVSEGLNDRSVVFEQVLTDLNADDGAGKDELEEGGVQPPKLRPRDWRLGELALKE